MAEPIASIVALLTALGIFAEVVNQITERAETPTLDDPRVPPEFRPDNWRPYDWSNQENPPDTTQVSQPPQIIYLPQVVDIRGIPPLPDRRLPQEADGQTATATVGKSITVNEALKNKKFGQLLWNPIKEGKQKLRIGFDPSLAQKIDQEFTESSTDFKNWVKAQLDPEYWQSSEYKESTNKFWAGFALIRPGQLKGHQNSLGVTYGPDWITSVAQSYYLRSMNAYMQVRDFIYKEWEIKQFNVPRKDARKVLDKNTELHSDAGTFYRLGLHRFPAEVPEFLLAPDPKEEEKKPPEERDKPIKINDSMSWQEWLVKNIDALFGQFPIKIKIEDNDLIKTGEQPIEITLPNLAETLAELTGKTLLNEAMMNLLINVNFRQLNEQGSTKLEGHITNKMVEEIVDYLGFENKKVVEKIRFLYNPTYEIKEGEQPNFEAILRETEIDIDVEEVVEKQSFEQKLDQLLFAAAIIQSALYERVDPNDAKKWGDFTDEFKSMVETFAGKKEEEKTEQEKEKKDDFDDFIEKVEDGFTGEPGIKDSLNPYSRPRKQRPRIQRLNRRPNNDGTN